MKNNSKPDRPLLHIVNLLMPGLSIDEFSATAGEGVCLIGTNTSGVDLFCDILAEKNGNSTYDLLEIPDSVGIFTFKRQQELFEEEVRRDDTDFMDRVDPGTPASSFLTDIEKHWELIEACNMAASLEKGYRQLSSGQSRKLCVLREITRGVPCLVVQNPYEGVDRQSCREMDKLFRHLCEQGMLVVITVNNLEDIPSWSTRLGFVNAGKLHVQGSREEVLPIVRSAFSQVNNGIQVSTVEIRHEKEQQEAQATTRLVRLNNGFAGYGEHQVFSGVNLVIDEGMHTLVTGPNGCGKSTLVQLITGDHPLCYRNDLEVFGIRRGSGESIWELKRYMGMVSPDLHRNHYVPGSALQVVVSGLFDSIGLYRRPTKQQEALARRWLKRIGMETKARAPFRRLTFAEQRLLLIARALIKVPRLLILDEPTQGLDQGNRKGLLDLLEGIAEENLCTLLYVSHRQDEYRPFFKQHLEMGWI